MGFWEFADRHALLVVFGFVTSLFIICVCALPIAAMFCDVGKIEKKREDKEV